MKYLFICGCPRSGTTALWRIISAHKNIGIGLERYIGKISPKFLLTPEHFSKERFFSYKEGDTHFSNIEDGEFGPFYKGLESNYSECMYLGDKIPILYTRYEELFKSFENAYVLFIFRNVFDVAQSYENRFNKASDTWKKDFKVAVKDWNISLGRTFQELQKGRNIFCIEYEELFFENYTLDSILNWLEIDSSDSFIDNYHEVKSYARKVESDRSINMSTPQKKYIMHNANFAIYKQILKNRK